MSIFHHLRRLVKGTRSRSRYTEEDSKTIGIHNRTFSAASFVKTRNGSPKGALDTRVRAMITTFAATPEPEQRTFPAEVHAQFSTAVTQGPTVSPGRRWPWRSRPAQQILRWKETWKGRTSNKLPMRTYVSLRGEYAKVNKSEQQNEVQLEHQGDGNTHITSSRVAGFKTRLTRGWGCKWAFKAVLFHLPACSRSLSPSSS